jgi:hypothetical protein
MYFNDLAEVYHKERRERDMFHDLMRYRVREILLVASLYDSFVLEQDGALSEQIYGEFFSLNLTTIPRVTCAYTPEDAKEMFVKFIRYVNFPLPSTYSIGLDTLRTEYKIISKN